jgi:class 3 adenylate cyclase
MALGSALRRAAKDERDLPFGTVTFLLTDVEASTAAWGADAEATDAHLRSLDEALRVCAASNDGRLIKSRGEGDSGFAVFHRASDAVLAAVDLQRDLADNALRVRAAVHTGEARLRDGDYFGVAPSRAARLRSLAHGGQIVVSQVSADLAEAELPDDISLTQLGTFRVRDWPRSVNLFGVRAPGVRFDFPALRVLGDSPQALMTVVSVDAVGSSAGVKTLSDTQLADVHRALAHKIRDAFQTSRGTFLKMLGDGCLAAFDNPVAAMDFGRSVIAGVNVDLRVAAAAGVVELIGDDLAGRVFYTVHEVSKRGPAGHIVVTRALSDLLAGQGLQFTPLPHVDGQDEIYSVDLTTPTPCRSYLAADATASPVTNGTSASSSAPAMISSRRRGAR